MRAAEAGDTGQTSPRPRLGWWDRRSLWWRLWLICTATVLAGGSTRMVLTVLHERDLAVQSTQHMQVMGGALLPLLRDLAAAGDDTATERLLAQWMAGTPALARARWQREGAGGVDEAGWQQQNAPSRAVATAPAWFNRVLRLPSPAWQVPLDDKRPELGRLVLLPDPATISTPAWRRVREQAMTVAGVVAAVSLALALGLRGTLAGVASLIGAARRFNTSDGTPPDLAPVLHHGPRELLALGQALREAAVRTLNAEKRLRHQAWHDGLTGLPNRAGLAAALGRLRGLACTEGQALAVCVLDLDEFGAFNQRYGHDCGDALLQALAQKLLRQLQPGEVLGHLGGDEFSVLLPGMASAAHAHQRLAELLHQLAQPLALAVPGKAALSTVAVGASAGYTLYPPDQADAEQLLRHAQGAMGVAKRLGRGAIECHDLGLATRVRERHATEQRLLQAVRSGELRLLLQPKVDIRLGRVLGAEALVRWQHPERGLLAPGDFLPDAQDGDAVIALDEWVLDQALTQMASWQAAGTGWPLAVNIAPHHFTSPTFFDHLQAALARHPGVPAQWLVLEVVESAALNNVEATAALIARCKTLGVGFALDDFGVGHASLSYLRLLPADQLKIDRSFVMDMLNDPNDLALVEAVIALARVFSLEVVAEGVENAEQGVLLMRLGCDAAQGYGIARPMPAAALAHWAQSWQPEPAWALWGETRWELSNLPLLTAQLDHLNWVRSVLQVLDGTALRLRADELADPQHCRFGRWYHSHGWRHYGQGSQAPAALRTVFDKIAPVHAEVHRAGAALVAAQAAGRHEEARAEAARLHVGKESIVALTSQLQRQMLGSP